MNNETEKVVWIIKKRKEKEMKKVDDKLLSKYEEFEVFWMFVC